MTAATRIEHQPAFVLHHRAYRDSSLLVELLCRDHGRVGAVARGARRPSSRLRGVLQPFQPLLVSWTGRGELVTLTAAEIDTVLPGLGREALMSAFYASELVLRLTVRHDPVPGVYRAYAHALTELAHGAAVEPLLRLFERRLIETLGYGLNLEVEAATGEPVVPERWYSVDREAGPRRCRGEGRAPCEVPGRALLALARGRLTTAEELRYAKRLMRYVLDGHLGPRPLRSREVRAAMRRYDERRADPGTSTEPEA